MPLPRHVATNAGRSRIGRRRLKVSNWMNDALTTCGYNFPHSGGSLVVGIPTAGGSYGPHGTAEFFGARRIGASAGHRGRVVRERRRHHLHEGEKRPRRQTTQGWVAPLLARWQRRGGPEGLHRLLGLTVGK